MAKATINDVAKLAGVSIKTVSRVVNQEANVSEDTRKRVSQAVTALHYRPNLSARSLAARRSYLIGVIYDDPSRYEVPSSGYVMKLQEGLLRACKEANYDLLIHPCGYRDPGIGREIRDFIDHSRLDGIVVAPPLSNVPAVIKAIRSKQTPFTLVAPGDTRGGELTVVTNDREVSAAMTAYLASLGHESIAFIRGHPKHKAVGHRFDGYRDGIEQSGLPYRSTLVVQGDNSIGSGRECARRLLKRKRRPTAIFASNDDMAAGVLQVAQQMKVDVPGELSIAGFDNIPLAQQIYPALTTVNQPLRQMADRAARLLIQSLQSNASIGEPVMVEGEIVVRESTGPAPG